MSNDGDGYGSHGYGTAYVGQAPTLGPPARAYVPRQMPSPQDAHRYLMACIRNLGEAGVSADEIATLLLLYGIDKAAGAGWNQRKIEDTFAELLPTIVSMPRR